MSKQQTIKEPRERIKEFVEDFTIIYDQELIEVLSKNEKYDNDSRNYLYQNIQPLMVGSNLLENYLVDRKLLSFLENNSNLKGESLTRFLWLYFKKKLNQDLVSVFSKKLTGIYSTTYEKTIKETNSRVFELKRDRIKDNNKLKVELRHCQNTFDMGNFISIKYYSIKLPVEPYDEVKKVAYEFSKKIIKEVIEELKSLFFRKLLIKHLHGYKINPFKNIESNKRLENLIWENLPEKLTKGQIVEFFLNEYKIKHNARKDEVLDEIKYGSRVDEKIKDDLYKNTTNDEITRKYLETLKIINDLEVNKKYLTIGNYCSEERIWA